LRKTALQPRFARLFLIWTLPVILLAVLALLGSPRRAVAQDAAQAAPSASSPSAPSSTASSSTAGSQAAETAPSDEQKELDTFRHAPIVAKIGQKMGLSVETTAKIFEALNFLIIFLAIVIPLVRYVPRILRNRSEALNRDIKAAREATADAQSRLKAVEAQLAGLAGEIAKFRTQMEQDSLEDEKRIKAAIVEESARIVSSAEQEIAAAAAQARRGLRHFAADLAIGQAEKQLVLTPETDRALIAEFVSDVARNGGKGGQN
jgi:F-type H+-transporting ATPase subunit b